MPRPSSHRRTKAAPISGQSLDLFTLANLASKLNSEARSAFAAQCMRYRFYSDIGIAMHAMKALH